MKHDTAFPVTIKGKTYRILPLRDTQRVLTWGLAAMGATVRVLEAERAGVAFRADPCAATLAGVNQAVAVLRDELVELILAYTADIPYGALRQIDVFSKSTY